MAPYQSLSLSLSDLVFDLQKRRSGRQVKRRKYNEDLDFKVVDDDGETIAVLGAGRASALSASTLAWQAEVPLAPGGASEYSCCESSFGNMETKYNSNTMSVLICGGFRRVALTLELCGQISEVLPTELS